jgi:hypothetical protein
MLNFNKYSLCFFSCRWIVQFCMTTKKKQIEYLVLCKQTGPYEILGAQVSESVVLQTLITYRKSLCRTLTRNTDD